MRKILAILIILLIPTGLFAMEVRIAGAVYQGVTSLWYFLEGEENDHRLSTNSALRLDLLAGSYDSVLVGFYGGVMHNGQSTVVDHNFYSGSTQFAAGLDVRIKLPSYFQLELGAGFAVGTYDRIDVMLGGPQALITLHFRPVEYFSIAPSIVATWHQSDLAIRWQVGFELLGGDMMEAQ